MARIADSATMERMTSIQRNTVLGILIALIILAAGAYAYKISHRGIAGSTPSAANNTATTTTTNLSSIQVTGSSGDYTIKQLPVTDSGVVAPDYQAPLVFSSSVSADARAELQKEFAAAEATLKTNATDFASWIALGSLRKMAGDYAGAAADWEYASAIYPTNVVSFSNLGDLYENYLKNYPKAVAAYQKEIVNNPADEDSYRTIFGMYTTVYPQAAPAPENILKAGITNVPKAIDLYVLLARYYASRSDTTDARAEYTAAIAQAQSQNNASLASQLQAELAALK